MSKKAQASTNGASASSTVEQAGPTETELAIAKFEARLAEKKHIDAKDFGLNFVFPLLRRIAKESGDQSEQLADFADDLADLAESVEAGGETAVLVDAFESARDMLAQMGSLIDTTMVTAGFYNVTNAGLAATDKIPAELRAAYEGIGARAAQVVIGIQEAIATLEERDEDEGDDDDEDSEDDVVAEDNDVEASTTSTPTDSGILAPNTANTEGSNAA